MERSMKELLSTMDPKVDPNSHIEFKQKTHILCARFLGGAWKTVSVKDMEIHRINWLIQLKRSSSGSTSFDLPAESHEWAPPTINCEALQKEIDNFRSLIVKSRSVVTFCHNDLLAGNILLPEAHSGNIRSGSTPTDFNKKDIVFIDFEYASYNYRGFDFANHFVERTINYGKKTTPFYEILPENFPTEGQMLGFMYNYHKERMIIRRDGRRKCEQSE